jgi:hypothetical protein
MRQRLDRPQGAVRFIAPNEMIVCLSRERRGRYR